MKKVRTALVFGATGACGKDLLDQLVGDERYDRIYAVVRRDTQMPDTIEQIVIPTLAPNDLCQLNIYADSIFCCLGTTIKKAGSQRAFRAVDEHLVKATIDYAERTGAQHFHLISAVGANEASMFFYSRIKAKTERYLVESNIKRWTIYQPSLLIRKTSDFRLGERLAEWLLAPLSWLPFAKRYAATQTCVIAASMIARDQFEDAPYPYYVEGGACT